MIKVTYLKLRQGELNHVRGLGSVKNREIRLGMPCDGTFGGGSVTRMELDRATSSVQIYKDCKFVGQLPGQGGAPQDVFEGVGIPISALATYDFVVEPDEVPVAKVVQQPQNQGNQQRR